jgi:colanic acid biosynthesis protein WcaH
MTLPARDFLTVVKSTPLVSIDLIIADPSGAILMGWRSNEPAKNLWFVPGGRIRKNEKIAEAFERIVQTETGLSASFHEAKFGGVFEHFYSSNFFDDPNFGTHYCVLAYTLKYRERPTIKTDGQHSKFDWLTKSSEHVHSHCRVYFDLLGHQSD